MTKIVGKTVLITGAAMGMGRLHAQRAIEKGAARLILWDRDEIAVRQTGEQLETRATPVIAQRMDVRDRAAIAQAADSIVGEWGGVDILINNAGVVTPGDFWHQSPESIETTIQVNSLGVMFVARAFLPSMIGRREAHLVNISSASALTPVPYGAVYAASKWAVYGWSESLRLELEDQGHHHVKVTTVCPSFVATGMFEGCKPPRLTRFLRPEEVVDAVWHGIERNKVIVVAPFIVHTIMPMRALLPLRVQEWINRTFFGINQAMKNLRGRGNLEGPREPSRESSIPLQGEPQEREVPRAHVH